MRKLKSFPSSRRQFLAGGATAMIAGFASGSAWAKAPMLGTQAPAFYRFKIGEFEATVVSDGHLVMGEPQDEFFKGFSKDDFAKALADNLLPTSNIIIEQNTLVLNTGKQLVLFDTGTGGARSFGTYAGRLIGNLKAAGFQPEDFDAVILTHAHPDHCWGLIGENDRRNFPNAQIYLTEADLKFWTDDKNGVNDFVKMMIVGAQKQLLPLRERMVLIKDGQEIVPGVQAIATPGHTVGHTAFAITSGDKTFLNLGDVAHHHVLSVERPRLELSFDTDSKLAVQSRLRVFDMLATDRLPFVSYHFPWPGIGYVGRQQDGFRYFPSPQQMTL